MGLHRPRGGDATAAAARSGRPHGRPKRVEQVDKHTVVVASDHPGPFGAAATRITIAHGRVVAMQQYASRDDALASSPTG